MTDNLNDLVKIKEAIENKDASAAGQLAEIHVTKFNELMKNKVAQSR
ncbi:MAG: hypothetical protein GY729_03110 [Desulfobacteraceae bacterium]|nr:hypothetical protein [Desulfobacteraceae bacterium]